MRTIDLFCGCGGLTLGFANAGFNVVAAFDNWKPAIETYHRNFSHPIFDVEIGKETNFAPFREWNPDIIIGGPPCQDFSSAGKRDETLGRADLTITFAQIVAEVAPPWFVMENVDRIEKSDSLSVAKQIFKNAGYGLSQQVLNSAFCGVPQNRKRFFLIGELGGEDNRLTPYFSKNLAKSPLTIHDYLGNSLSIEYYYRHPRSYKRRAIFSIYEPSPTIRGVNRPIPKTYKIHAGDATIVTPHLRPLTTLERSYIQTFPTDFIFHGSKTDLEQMIGNAVPVNLATYVANCILKYVRDKQEGVVSALTKQELYHQLSLL